MTITWTDSSTETYERRLAELSIIPLWAIPVPTEPGGPEITHRWDAEVVLPELYRSPRTTSGIPGDLQRRALNLRNPGLPPGPGGTTATLVAAYDILFPGEQAPAHAHSMSALRFAMAGGRMLTTVDGVAIPMEPGDLVLTPGWAWHGHAHVDGDQPAVWLDGLDVPMVIAMRANFLIDTPPTLPTRTDLDEFTLSAAIRPSGQHSRHSQVRRYPWEAAYSALQALMGRLDREDRTAAIEYTNPLTGGPALATIGCQLEGLPDGVQTRRARETASSVLLVVKGTGMLVAGGQSLPLRPHDVCAIPAWTWHHIEATDNELILFRMTDRPTHQTLGLYRKQHTTG